MELEERCADYLQKVKTYTNEKSVNLIEESVKIRNFGTVKLSGSSYLREIQSKKHWP